jgi:plasmid maintenance system antidote protein VapI
MFINMKKNKLTQKKIAKATALCREFICKVLNDQETISATTAEKIGRAHV